MIDEDNGWAVGFYGQAYNTTDGGTNWVYQRLDTQERHLWAVQFIDSNIGWIVGEEGAIFKTIDGGTNWTSQWEGEYPSLTDVYFIDSQNGWVVGRWFYVNDGIIMYTSDGGETWENQESDTTTGLHTVFFTDKYHGWAGGRDGTILKWVPNNYPPYFISLNKVTAYEDSLFVYTAQAVDPEDSTVSYTFIDYPVWLTPSDSTISGTPSQMDSDTSFQVIASDGELTDTLFVEVTIEHDQSSINNLFTGIPKLFCMEQNYPNPFNPITKIRFGLPKSDNISLIIYDLLGKEIGRIAEGYFEAGYHTVIWDGSDWASGIYLYRLTTSENKVTRKLILQK